MKTIAVIGCGRIAKNAHFPAFNQIEGLRIKYACDLIEEKAMAMKNAYPNIIENVITDYQIALADKEVDAVYVLTPNYAHYTITMDALRAGKHVFCEKPITINYELSLEMAAEAKKQNKMLCIGVCNRYSRSIELLNEYYNNGKFGNLYSVYCSFRSFRAIPGLGGPFTDKAQSGGGVLIDWGVHFFDLVLYVMNGAKLKSVTCDTYSKLAKDMKAYVYPKGTMWAEDTADIENGVNDVEDFISGFIRTDKASISFNGAWSQNIESDDMFIDFLGDKGGARLTYGGKFKFTDGQTLKTEEPEYELNQMVTDEDKAFLESLDTGIKERNHIDNVLETAKLLDALYASSSSSKEINF